LEISHGPSGMELGRSGTKVGRSTKARSKTEREVDLGSVSLKTGRFTREIGKMTFQMVRVLCFQGMEKFWNVNL